MTEEVYRAHVAGKARAQLGVSLVELMVALTLGLFVVGGAVSIYLANRNSFATVENVARVEENARFAVELLARDIREAGGTMCGGVMTSTNLVSSPATNWATWETGILGNAMVGNSNIAGVSVGVPTGNAAQVSNTDSLLIWSASTGNAPVRITSHTLGDPGTFQTATAHGYKNGDLVVACDGKQLVTFEVQNADTYSVQYIGGSAIKTFATSGLLSPLTIHLWYVGGNSQGTPANALRRMTLDKNGPIQNALGNPITPDELITGVSNLQVKYLVGDVLGVPDPVAVYQTAAPAPSWEKVIAVQITLTLSSLDKINPASGAPSVFTYTLPLTVGVRRRLQP